MSKEIYGFVKYHNKRIAVEDVPIQCWDDEDCDTGDAFMAGGRDKDGNKYIVLWFPKDEYDEDDVNSMCDWYNPSKFIPL